VENRRAGRAEESCEYEIGRAGRCSRERERESPGCLEYQRGLGVRRNEVANEGAEARQGGETERGCSRWVIAAYYHNAWLSRLIGSAYADRQIIINHVARGLPFMCVYDAAAFALCVTLAASRLPAAAGFSASRI